MGFIRYLLAAAVVMVHGPANPLWLPPGNVAVESFFILSGFYMALILNEQYTKTIPFWLNRFLRLFPLYWLLFILAIPFRHGVIHTILALPLATKALLIATNLGIVGQDLLFYLTPSLHFTAAPLASAPARLHTLILIPPSWTLSLELCFYLLAPFLVRSPIRLAILAAASLTLRLVLISQGYTEDPFLYRLFPQELLFFCLGSLAWHLLRYLKAHHPEPLARAALPTTAFILAWLATFSLIPLPAAIHLPLWYAALTLALPFIFHATGKLRASNWLGELSYPLYLSHLLVIWSLTRYAPHIPILNTHPALLSLTILAIATALAFLLHTLVEIPIAPLRRKLRNIAR